ncbi:MAG: hypothetical protein KAV83_00210 [Desulfobacterales bacterium]|nr:hypothetical protein [Desulfobacterales bacterium]
MDIKEAVGSVLKDLIVPELDKIKEENKEIKATLVLTNKRLDDINLHLADQSRRIDSVREELSQRMDETNNRIDSVREELSQRMDETNNRIDSVREELSQRTDRLYEVIVRRDEHHKLDERVGHLEREVNELKRMAA